MDIKISGDNFQITPRVQELVDKKISKKLDSYLPHFNAGVKFALLKITKRSRWGYKISFNMTLPKNHHIFCEEKDTTIPKTLTKLRNTIIRQITKYKERLTEH